MARKPDEDVPVNEDLNLNFKWNIYHPDQREYRNQSIEVEPIEIYVQLDIPKDYGNITPEGRIVLSVAGLKYVTDLFDGMFLKKEETKVDSDDEWETDVSTNRPSASKDGNDDWDAEFDEDKTGTDKKDWDEKEEEWE